MREKPWPELNVVESISATKNRRAKHNRQDRLLLKKMQYLNTWLMVWGLTLDAKTSFCWLYSAAVFGNELPVNIVSFDVPWFYQRDLPSAGLHHASLTSGISRLSGTLYYMIGRVRPKPKISRPLSARVMASVPSPLSHESRAGAPDGTAPAGWFTHSPRSHHLWMSLCRCSAGSFRILIVLEDDDDVPGADLGLAQPYESKKYH